MAYLYFVELIKAPFAYGSSIRRLKRKQEPKRLSIIRRRGGGRDCGNPRLWAIISRSIHLSTWTVKETVLEIILASD